MLRIHLTSICFNQVSAVTEQAGLQVGGATTGDLDDDEGGGLVCFPILSTSFLLYSLL